MSSPQEAETVDLKGGHAPAVKVAGKRIVQHKKEGEKVEGAVMTAEEEVEYGSSPSKVDKHHQAMLVSGVVTKGDKDFTTQAVKSIHEKPQPHIEQRPRHPQSTHQINQPR